MPLPEHMPPDLVRRTLALSYLPGLGAKSFHALIRHFGDAGRVFDADSEALHAVTLGDSGRRLTRQQYDSLRNPPWKELDAQLDADLRWLEQEHNHLVTAGSDAYPELLAQLADAPPVLYIHGNTECLHRLQLAIVGSRTPSSTGNENALLFAHSLAEAGLVITSGLAHGIDTAAHRGALRAGGRTIAVMGTALDRVYPAQNKALAHEIAATGALVSEFPIGTGPRAENFPRRNRIITGLSLGCLVVEAARKSGSLISARHALEQGREVFAIPGSIHNPLARGCHQLIREGAKLVESSADIISELGPLIGTQIHPTRTSRQPEPAAAAQQNPEHEQMLDAMGYDPVTVDALAARTEFSVEEVASMLLILELDGRVRSDPGGYYVRLDSSVR